MPVSCRTVQKPLHSWYVKRARRKGRGPTCLSRPNRWRTSSPTIAYRGGADRFRKAGSVVAAQAAKHIKKSTLELGGNDVFVVLDDADLEKAVKIGVNARLNNAGQVCTAAKRFILHEKIADAFLNKFTEAFKQVKIGDPLDESTTLGPLSSKDALETLTKQVNEAVKKRREAAPWRQAGSA